MALLANLAAELPDRGVLELTEAVGVGDLLVIVESGRGALLETKDAHIHCNHVPTDDCIEVVEAVGSEVPFLIRRVALVVVGRGRRIGTVVGISLASLSGLAGHSSLGSCHCRWRLVGQSISVESWSISAQFGCSGSAAVGSGIVVGLINTRDTPTI